MKLDDTDIKILTALDRDGEIDAEDLADEIGVSSSTVYYRLESYREHGILDGKLARIDPRQLGYELTAITEINSEYGASYDQLGENLADLSGVQEVYQMLGDVSFIVISLVRNHDELQGLINEIINMPGVIDSSTNIVLETVKRDGRLLANYDDDDLQALTAE